jgi:hypothetical protein
MDDGAAAFEYAQAILASGFAPPQASDHNQKSFCDVSLMPQGYVSYYSIL